MSIQISMMCVNAALHIFDISDGVVADTTLQFNFIE